MFTTKHSARMLPDRRILDDLSSVPPVELDEEDMEWLLDDYMRMRQSYVVALERVTVLASALHAARRDYADMEQRKDELVDKLEEARNDKRELREQIIQLQGEIEKLKAKKTTRRRKS